MLTSNINLWPPNHKMVSIDVLAVTGITDPDGDAVTITINAIRRTNQSPAPATAPELAQESRLFDPNATADGNGRVYGIAFTANDSQRRVV